MGLRGAEPRASQAAPVFRVLTVGDSVTFGQGVADDETLAAQLETRLARRHEGTLVEVLNLGVPGYDTCQEYWSYRDRAPQSRHDVVLLLYYENDTDPSVFRVENGVVISPDTKVGAFHEAMAWARKSVMSYNLVWTRWQVLKQRFASRARYRDDVAAKFTENNQGWQRSRACLKELLELAHQHAGRVLVIPFPVPGFLRERPYPHHDYVETVCKVVTSGGADCLDVVEILQRSETPLTVSVVENHPSAQVYEIVANQIVASLP
jgi:lysophospholipase L1-like esterase